MRYTNDGTFDGFPLINGDIPSCYTFWHPWANIVDNFPHNAEKIHAIHAFRCRNVTFFNFFSFCFSFLYKLLLISRLIPFTILAYLQTTRIKIISSLKLFDVLFVKLFDDKKDAVGCGCLYVCILFFQFMQRKRAGINSHSTINPFSSSDVLFS